MFSNLELIYYLFILILNKTFKLEDYSCTLSTLCNQHTSGRRHESAAGASPKNQNSEGSACLPDMAICNGGWHLISFFTQRKRPVKTAHPHLNEGVLSQIRVFLGIKTLQIMGDFYWVNHTFVYFIYGGNRISILFMGVIALIFIL